MKCPLFCTALTATGILLQNAIQAETITVLESFEQNVDGADHFLAEGERRITEFSQSDSNDYGQVTDGEKALKISFESLRGWKQDAQVLLTPEATTILNEVVEGLAENPEVGRHYLLYDITWDKLEANVGWANNPVNIGGHGTGAQIEWGGGNQVVTMNYDLGAGLPEGFALNFEGDNGDQTALRLIFNSNTDDPMDVYVDNIRLLDTKPEGASTEVTVLDSFEENFDAILPTGSRITDDPVANEDEFFVTHGEKSAKFVMSDEVGGWHQDFTINLELYPILEEILALPQEERFQYSIAWDWIPEVGDASVNWFQETINPGGPGMRVTQGWSGDGNAKTRVINLGLVEWDFPPTITVIHNSSQPWGAPVNLYFDNLRLINTGAGATAPDRFEITEVNRSADGMVTLSWNSFEGGTYSIDSSTDLVAWDELDDGVVSEGEITSFTHAAGAATDLHYRVNLLE